MVLGKPGANFFGRVWSNFWFPSNALQRLRDQKVAPGQARQRPDAPHGIGFDQAHYKKLETLAGKIGFEASLMTALPTSLLAEVG